MGVLTISCLLLLLLVVAAVGYVCNRPHSSACLEPRCIQATAGILEVMDLDTDPCQDFYQYACGKYAEVSQIPDGKSKWSYFTKASQHNNLIMKKLFEREGDIYQGVHSKAVQKAKLYYTTCMNETLSETVKAEPLLKLIESLGGWSLLGDDIPAGQWNEETWSLTETINQLHEMRMFVLFIMGVASDDQNSTMNIAQFHQSGLGLNSPAIYANNDTKIVDAYVELGATTIALMRLNGSSASRDFPEIKQEARERIQDIVKFEETLSKLFVPKEDLQDPIASYNKMPLEELAAMVPSLDLVAYAAHHLGSEVDGQTEVVVYSPAYFRRLRQLLEDTPKRLLADYTIWYTIRPFLKYLSEPFREAVLDFSRVVRGVSSQPPLWERCMFKVDSAFGFVTGALYVEEKGSEITKKKTVELMEEIRQAFIERLPGLDWMDEETKARALDKVEAMKDKIGFPDWILDPEKLDDYHGDVNITHSSNLDNMVSVLKYFRRKSLQEFGKAVDKTSWSMTPADVNAYYSASLNQMVFPSGILQAPFFDNDVPMSMNFGAIGMIMGHELTHGFDNHGRLFDKFGNLHDWWENKSALAYQERTDCMVKQYSGYQEYGLNLDGQFTLGENIADNGGIKIAFQAYQNWRRDNPEDLVLPLNLTAEQEFFLGMAQVWCSYKTPEHAQIMIYTDTHASDRFRVIGSMSNMPAFAEAYQCPEGSPMNPVERCEVW